MHLGLWDMSHFISKDYVLLLSSSLELVEKATIPRPVWNSRVLLSLCVGY